MRQVRSKPELGLFWCSGCEALLRAENFYQVKSRSTGVSSRCKPCSVSYSLQWKEKNQDRASEAKLRHAKSVKASDSAKKWRAKNRRHLNDYMSRWRDVNPERVKTRSLPTWIDKEQVKRMYAEARLLTTVTGVKHHVDHIIPLRGKNVCGLHVQNNLRVIPASENARKRNKFEENWS